MKTKILSPLIMLAGVLLVISGFFLISFTCHKYPWSAESWVNPPFGVILVALSNSPILIGFRLWFIGSDLNLEPDSPELIELDKRLVDAQKRNIKVQVEAMKLKRDSREYKIKH